jgi:lysophospholipase L1-like esterase
MEFNYPNPHELHEIFEPDSITFWRLKPGVKMGDNIEPINSKGFRGPEFSKDKPAGVRRVVTLGDSVTFGGALSYPRLLADCLDGGWEVVNAGAPGYSAFQGLKLFESRIAPLKPDVVTIMFGWNDHWLARGITDSRQSAMKSYEMPGLINSLKELRIYQLINYVVAHNAGSADKNAPVVYRVPIDEYRVVIEKLVDTARGSGAQVVLITTPSALDVGKVPAYFAEIGFIERVEGESEKETALRLNRLHSSYNNVVRDVASEKGAILVDIESQWRARGTGALFRDPAQDVVHPNEEGYRLIGATLCDTIKSIHFGQIP